MEQAEPEFEEFEGEIIARTHEIARWREGDFAYARDFAVPLDSRRRKNRQHHRHAWRRAAPAGAAEQAQPACLSDRGKR